MEKKLLVLLVFIVGLSLSCEKPTCGCSSPPPRPVINLVVMNLTGEDLLNPVVNGSYSTSDIKLYRKSVSGNSAAVKFEIHKPILAGDFQVKNYHLSSNELINSAYNALNPKADTTYLQFGSEQPYKVLLQYTSIYNNKLNLFMGGYDVQQDEKWPVSNKLFYFTKR